MMSNLDDTEAARLAQLAMDAVIQQQRYNGSMSEPTQEMLDAWAKIPKPKDRPYCRVCRSTDVTMIIERVTPYRWHDYYGWIKSEDGLSSESMGCNECKTLDLPIQTRFSFNEDDDD